MKAHYIREQKHICGERYMEVDLFEVTDYRELEFAGSGGADDSAL